MSGNRTTLAATLAGEIDEVDSTDIVILNQEIVRLGFGFSCVDVSMRVLGPSCEYSDRLKTVSS